MSSHSDNLRKKHPIFIVGMNGSGTSVVSRCLGQHSEIFSVPGESKFYTTFRDQLPRYGDLNVDNNYLALWRDIAAIPIVRLRAGLIRPPDGWQNHVRTFASAVDSVFLECAKRENGKQKWSEKCPHNTLHIQEIVADFPNAMFICVVRDGRACAASLKRRFSRTPELTMLRWRWMVEAVQTARAVVNNQILEVRYEQFVEDPEQELRRICNFLGINYEAEMTDADWSSDRALDQHNIVAGNSRWQNVFSQDAIHKMETIAGATLSRMGYQLLASTMVDDKDPPQLRQKYWRYKDYFVQLCRDLYNQAMGRGYLTWGEYLSYLRNAVRQEIFNLRRSK